ncbi:MAG: ATP-binding cassette domain-containing protein [Deltaproteobacteria bacterium]|nr:ATP-binding cassette domain-containing protein [Deltaproteobacteria bacterium]
MIQVTELHKCFGDVVAVDDVSFEAPDGAITGLLGPNGAGKTTCLRMVYGLFAPDRGLAAIDGIDITARPRAARQRLGALPDARGLYPRLTARENVRYYGQLHGLGKDALERRIEKLFVLLDMGEIADRRAAGFSQGERMKVAIARSIVHAPRNVLLDEPTTGLDVMSIRALRRFIRQLRDEGSCVVLSSHVMQEVSALCDEIVVLAHGKVVGRGTPDELRRLTGLQSLEEVFVKLTLGDRYVDEGEPQVAQAVSATVETGGSLP